MPASLSHPGWIRSRVVRRHPVRQKAAGHDDHTERIHRRVVRPPSTSTADRPAAASFVRSGSAALPWWSPAPVLSYRVFDTAALEPGQRAGVRPVAAVAGRRPAAGRGGRGRPGRQPAQHPALDLRHRRRRRSTSSSTARARPAAVDPFGREQHIGLGCALENLVLACRARGLQPEVTLLPDGATPHGSPASLSPRRRRSRRPLYDAIGDRHTNRGPYQAGRCRPRRWLPWSTPTGLPGLDVHWITDPAPMAELGQLMVDAAAGAHRRRAAVTRRLRLVPQQQRRRSSTTATVSPSTLRGSARWSSAPRSCCPRPPGPTATASGSTRPAPCTPRPPPPTA